MEFYSFSGFFLEFGDCYNSHLKVNGWNAEFLVTSLRQQKGREREEVLKQRRQDGNGNERKAMMERGKAGREAGRCKKRRKEGRKGKQVEFLMLAIMVLPGQVFQRPAMTLNAPNCQKQPITQCWLNGSIVCVYVCILGV